MSESTLNMNTLSNIDVKMTYLSKTVANVQSFYDTYPEIDNNL